MITFIHRHRQAIVWLCIGAALLLGVGAQLHALSHSLQAVQASAHKDPLAAHTQTCDQCLQFAALDAGMPAHAAVLLLVSCVADLCAVPATPLRASAFTTYLSRAPPPLG